MCEVCEVKLDVRNQKNWHVHQFVMIHNKRRETCGYVYCYLGLTAAGTTLPGTGRGRAYILGETIEERKHRKEGVLEGSTGQSQDV